MIGLILLLLLNLIYLLGLYTCISGYLNQGGCVQEGIVIFFLKFLLFPLILIIVLIYTSLINDYCEKCSNIVWRWQSKVRKEDPFISYGENYPTIQTWHLKCYKIPKKRIKDKESKD